MKCDQVVLLLSEYLQEELSHEATQEIQLHLSNCTSCQKEQKELFALSSFLLKNPPSLPQSLSFQMMSDRVWEEMKQPEKSRWGFWIRALSLSATFALLVFLVWPKTDVPEDTSTPISKELLLQASLELEQEITEETFSFTLSHPEEFLEEIDEETASKLIEAKLFSNNTAPEEEPRFLGDDFGEYLDELEELTPEEIERLEDILLQEKKKG